MLEYGLRNFLGSHEGSKIGIEDGKSFQMEEKNGGVRQGGRIRGKGRKVKQGDSSTIQYAPGAPT